MRGQVHPRTRLVRNWSMRILSLLLAATTFVTVAPSNGAPPRVAPLAAAEPNRASQETAVLAGGCFWGVEGVFERVKGVRRVVSGYAGGRVPNPGYEAVSSGTTGAAEAVRIDFDPRVISYAQLLQIYFSVVTDPTQKDRQGPDVGSQYRTALFPVSPSQARQARAYIAQLTAQRAFSRPIVTTLEKGRFWTAEAYHQDYMRRHPNQPYIVMHDRPKLAAFKRHFPTLVR